jgi:hypothetical protein
MLKFFIIFRYIALLANFCLLSGCLGGTFAQQITRSIATSVADKAMARAMDVDEDEDEDYSEAQYTATANTSAKINVLQKTTLQGPASQAAHKNIQQQNTAPDPYKVAFVNAAFEEIKPVTEPLPQQFAEVETPIQVFEGNQLVRVELFNLLIGEEKNAVYENARMMGATSLPQKREWLSWGVGTGAIQKDKKVITFLIPPELGKLPSGTMAVVELASPGEINVARYRAN